jgi:hypothetical protein
MDWSGHPDEKIRRNLEPLAAIERQSWTGCGLVSAGRTPVAHIELESGHERFEWLR